MINLQDGALELAAMASYEKDKNAHFGGLPWESVSERIKHPYREDAKLIVTTYMSHIKLRSLEMSPKMLPKTWQVGHKVRMLADKDFAWNKGDIMYIVNISDEYRNTPADRYQVFSTSHSPDVSDGRRWTIPDRFWTTPNDVEWIDEDNKAVAI
jgi:hypothetical protein